MKFHLFLLLTLTLGIQNSFGQLLPETCANIIEKVDGYYYADGSEDIDSLVRLAGRELVAVLETTVLGEDVSQYGLSSLVSKDEKIRIHTFSYHSGGTRGVVHHPVLQWVKSDGTFGSYELFPADKKGFFGLEVEFYEIFKLPSATKDLYLLLGGEKGSSMVLLAHALVIEIKNDYLILDYPAFYGSSSNLAFFDSLREEQDCYACLEYDAVKRELNIPEIGIDDNLGPMYNTYQLDNKLKDEKSIRFVFRNDSFELD